MGYHDTIRYLRRYLGLLVAMRRAGRKVAQDRRTGRFFSLDREMRQVRQMLTDTMLEGPQW